MLTFEALRPLRLNTKTRGTLSLQTGERVTWPDEAVKQLLAKIPERIRLVPESESWKPCPFQIGQPVVYQVPVIEKAPFQYHWETHRGVILAVNAFAEMVLIQSHDEPGMPWRWLWRGYVERATNAQE